MPAGRRAQEHDDAGRPIGPTAGRKHDGVSTQRLGAPAPAGERMILRALQRANEVRLARAELKRRVADGELTVSEVVLNSPWEAESMAIADLLMSQRRWGRTRCRRFLAQVPLSETKTIGSLTERQRLAIAARLDATSVGTMDDAERVHSRPMASMIA
jgi:hypothetical protein